jgi:20S proteasome alpha/beta subunit
MTALKEQYHAGMSIVEAEKMVAQVLKSNMEEKMTKDNVEIMVVKTSTR